MTRLSVAALFCLINALTACEDDFGENMPRSGLVAIKVTAPEEWTSAVAVDESSPDSRCVSVDIADSESTIPLYLHTVESDNIVSAPASRGARKESVENFSMSAICYTGDYPQDETKVSWTPNFAYNLTCGVTGNTASCPESLLWPASGTVRFFAFAPVSANRNDDPFTLSNRDFEGSPQITYTVDDDIAAQRDLMAACTDAHSPAVNLEFRHTLTAVKVVTADDMIPGEITKVTLSGIPSTGIYIPRPDAVDDKWIVTPESTKSYTVETDVTVGGKTDGDYSDPDDDGNIVGNADSKDTDNKELIGDTDDLTLLMIPQTLPDGAELEIVFKEALTGEVYTLSASLKGKTWPQGKIVTYYVSPSSIHITPVVEFNKSPENQNDILPYSGVWHDVTVKAYAAVTKVGESVTRYVKLPTPEIKYSFDGAASTGIFCDSLGRDVAPVAEYAETEKYETDPDKIISERGTYCLKAQSDFETLQNKFASEDLKTFSGFENDKINPVDLYDEGSKESANCYMVGKPGYYMFPVVYGNTYKNGALNSEAITIKNTTSGLKHYVDYKCNRIDIDNYKITQGVDAVLAWQDAPDLVDAVELIPAKDGKDGLPWVRFRVRGRSITQGNALIVVRDENKDIVWSWHIWVSQHTNAWMKTHSDCKTVRSIYGKKNDYKFTGKKYNLTSVNLGYCDPHNGNPGRTFNISFIVAVNANSKVEVKQYKYTGTGKVYKSSDSFRQMEFKGSLGGDNTYYQWGRSAPTPGGIYNDDTQTYEYKSGDYSELNMENKPIFNGYENGKYYLTRNAQDDYANSNSLSNEKGKTIDWAISHPHVFIMSKYDKDIKPDGTNGLPDYRDHWHIIDEIQTVYAYSSNLFQMWNPIADGPVTSMETKEEDVAKSVYDPCPAGYLVPPANLFSAFANHGSYSGYNLYDSDVVYDDNDSPHNYEITIIPELRKWTVITGDGETFEFPATGVRDKSLRYSEFGTVEKVIKAASSRVDPFKDNCNLGGETYPAFRMLTYLSSSNYIGGSGNSMAIFYIDNRHYEDTNGDRKTDKSATSLTLVPDNPGIGCYQASASSYGLSVRPIRDDGIWKNSESTR